jgi:hypothetical protein
MLDRDTGVVVEKTLTHEGEAVREFYTSIPPPVVVGIEATGSMGWFLRLMEELAIRRIISSANGSGANRRLQLTLNRGSEDCPGDLFAGLFEVQDRVLCRSEQVDRCLPVTG